MTLFHLLGGERGPLKGEVSCLKKQESFTPTLHLSFQSSPVLMKLVISGAPVGWLTSAYLQVRMLLWAETKAELGAGLWPPTWVGLGTRSLPVPLSVPLLLSFSRIVFCFVVMGIGGGGVRGSYGHLGIG